MWGADPFIVRDNIVLHLKYSVCNPALRPAHEL
jgi:hypothetical protein